MGGFRAVPYATVLAQVNHLDDAVFKQLPPQPPKKKAGSPSKQKQKEKLGEGSGESSSTSKQSEQPQRSEKAQHILGTQEDHTPEEANVWAYIMRGRPPSKRKRANQSEMDEAYEEEEEEEQDVVFENTGEDNDSPEITIKHTTQLKKLETQYFCGKGGFKSSPDVERHRLAVHTGHGKGVNPKTKSLKITGSVMSAMKYVVMAEPVGNILEQHI